MAEGMPPDDAAAEARRRFGDREYTEAELATIAGATNRRRSWGEWTDALSRDSRYAVRGLARQPAFTAVVVLTLALGIGANTAIFSLVRAVLLRPLPTPALDQLVVIQEDLLKLNLLGAQISPGEAIDLRARRDLFQASTAYTGGNSNLTGIPEPRRLATVSTMGDFFTVFGVQPAVGRLYRAEDSQPGAPRVVVLSHALWQDLAGGDLRFVGRSIELNGDSYEVIGVLPAEFRYPRSAQIFRPFTLTQRALSPEQRHSLYMTFVGRLAPGVTIERVRTQLRAEADRWSQRFANDMYAGRQFVLRPVPFVEYVAGQLRPTLLVLMGAVVLVLLIACANVASLQLVRAAARTKDIAVRAALGAGRGAVMRQLLAESVLLALAGGALGIGVGALTLKGLARIDADGSQMLQAVRLDGAVLAFTAGVAIIAGLASGLFPALRASRIDLQDVLKESTRGASLGVSRHRVLQGGIIVQMALTLVLLLASALTVRSLTRLLEADLGFRPAHVVAMRISLSGGRYGNDPARLAFYDAVRERLRANPTIQAAGIGSFVPFGSGSDSSPFEIIGRPSLPNGPQMHADIQIIEGDYLKALGIPLLEGRAFTDADNAPTVIPVLINEQLAKQYFGTDDPLGKHVSQGRPATIVGVVGNVRRSDIGEPPKATIYYHYPQYAWLGTMYVALRTTLPADAAAALVRGAVREQDPNVPVFDVMTMDERVERSLGARRLTMLVLTGFAALALALAVLGIYGVLSYSVAQRTHEIGIRLALGAEPQDVVRLIVRGGVGLAALGLAGGLVVFLAISRVLDSLLYGIGPRDPTTIAAGVVLLIIIALIASWLPARRAARVDPVVSLRAE